MKVVLQDGIKDCGICSLLSIIRFYGGDVSKEYLREITDTTKDGVSLYNLHEAAKYLGFESQGVSGKIENIDINSLPCIAHLIVNKSYRHFVVIYQINKNKKQVLIMDPAKGKKQISFSEFNLLSSNNYLLLKPVKKLVIMKKKNIISKNIHKLLKKNKISLLLLFILTTSYFILNIIASFHFKYILEYSINYSLSKNITKVSIIMLIIYLSKSINLFLRNVFLYKLSSIFDNEITTQTFQQILLLPYSYYKNRTTGEVVSRFKDLNTIRNFVTNLFATIITDSLSIIIFSIIMFRYNYKLTFYLLFMAITMIIFLLLRIKSKKKLITLIKKKEDQINTYLIEGISNVDTTKGSHLEKRLIDKFRITYQNFQSIIYKYNINSEINMYLKNNINDLFYIIIYGLGGYYVITDKMSLGTLIVYQSFFLIFLNNFYHIIGIVEEYNNYKNASERIEEIYLLTTDNFKNNYFYLPYKLCGNIKYANLNLQIGSKKIFDNLNLQISKGDKILLSGASGNGKSTLVKILLRYIQIPYGYVSIADIDINHYHLENIRSNISYITSNEYLFTDTIKNNIILNKEYNEDIYNEVCRVCLIDDIIKNRSLGDNTIIEENGFNLSNGERQRIIIARSLMRNANIYIFDEALSQIDITKEKKILINLFEYLKDKTIIIISHRFNNKKLFSRVLKLENGVIYEGQKL